MKYPEFTIITDNCKMTMQSFIKALGYFQAMLNLDIPVELYKGNKLMGQNKNFSLFPKNRV